MSEPIIPSVTSSSEPLPAPGSLHYWKSLDGSIYQEMIRTRMGQGNRVYGQQEQFLTALIQAEQRRLGRPLDVLEFGCGFGRHASYLAGLEGVRYHGFDMSEPMVAPLRQAPPAGMSPLDERLFVGDDPLTTLGSRRFDLVFTVSVLIHNPSESISRVMENLGRLVRPEGLMCLVENQLVPFGVWENAWHQGCWLQSFAEAMPPGWDLHHGAGFIDTHDLYVLKRNGDEARRYFKLRGPEQARDESQPLTLEALKLQGLPRLSKWASGAAHALQHAASSVEVRVHELQERLQVETERTQRRQRLFALAEDLAELRNRSVKPPRVSEPAPAQAPQPGVLFNAPLDITWAHHAPSLAGVLHVFHQQWYGIRAAAGYSPGRKLAITAERPLSTEELRQAVEFCANSSSPVVVIHSFSANAHALILALRKALKRSVRILGVWHGSSAQFHYPHEYETFASLVELRARGIINGVACVKPDMHLVSSHISPKTLLNLPPRVDARMMRPLGARSDAALIPTPNDWRKNFHTNLYACMAAPRVGQVYVTAQFSQPESLELVSKPVHRIKSMGRGELFQFMRKVDVVLNASLSECQPMTALEGLALRVPCITGPLGLGALDEHPFQQLTQIARVDQVGAVRDAIERVLELQERSPQKLREMMDSYEARLCSEAIQSYEDFIHS